MQAKRYIVPAILLLVLAWAGCTRVADAPNSNGQAATSQNSTNAAPPANDAANQPVAASRGDWKQRSEQLREQRHAGRDEPSARAPAINHPRRDADHCPSPGGTIEQVGGAG